MVKTASRWQLESDLDTLVVQGCDQAFNAIDASIAQAKEDLADVVPEGSDSNSDVDYLGGLGFVAPAAPAPGNDDQELCSLFGLPGDIPIPVELTAEDAEPQAPDEDGMNDISGEDDEAAGAGNAQQIRSSGAVGVDPSTSTSSTGAVGVDPSTSTSSTGAVGLDPSTSTMDSAQNLLQALQCAADEERPELLRRFGMIQEGMHLRGQTEDGCAGARVATIRCVGMFALRCTCERHPSCNLMLNARGRWTDAERWLILGCCRERAVSVLNRRDKQPCGHAPEQAQVCHPHRTGHRVELRIQRGAQCHGRGNEHTVES